MGDTPKAFFQSERVDKGVRRGFAGKLSDSHRRDRPQGCRQWKSPSAKRTRLSTGTRATIVWTALCPAHAPHHSPSLRPGSLRVSVAAEGGPVHFQAVFQSPLQVPGQFSNSDFQNVISPNFESIQKPVLVFGIEKHKTIFCYRYECGLSSFIVLVSEF